jgi:hypothetical protein
MHQQLVFSAVPELLYCFCLSLYVAAISLTTLHDVDVNGITQRFDVKPDAAITATIQRLSKDFYVLCMMELKHSSKLSR